MEKKERKHNHLPFKCYNIILSLLGRISSGEEGKDGHFEGENQNFKKWRRISCCRELYKPLLCGAGTELNTTVSGTESSESLSDVSVKLSLFRLCPEDLSSATAFTLFKIRSK